MSFCRSCSSLSARRAWIEISHLLHCLRNLLVALRKESVDRNLAVWAVEHAYQVALRKESVDRNKYVVQCRKMLGVALRKESVDRNDAVQIVIVVVHGRSPQGERG